MHPLIGQKRTSELWMSTFHSFGLRFLREEKKLLKLTSKFTVFDQGDTLGAIKEILRELRRAGAARSSILQRSWRDSAQELSLSPTPARSDSSTTTRPRLFRTRLGCARWLGRFRDLCGCPCARSRAAKPRAKPARALRSRPDASSRTPARLQLALFDAATIADFCVVGDAPSNHGWRGAR